MQPWYFLVVVGMELGMNHARLGSLLELGRIEGLVGVAAFKRLLAWLLKLQMCSTCHLVSSATTKRIQDPNNGRQRVPIAIPFLSF